MRNSAVSDVSPSSKPRPHETIGTEPGGGGERTSLETDALRRAFLDHLAFSRHPMGDGTALDQYQALALSIRDRLVQRWTATQRAYAERERQARSTTCRPSSSSGAPCSPTCRRSGSYER